MGFQTDRQTNTGRWDGFQLLFGFPSPSWQPFSAMQPTVSRMEQLNRGGCLKAAEDFGGFLWKVSSNSLPSLSLSP